MGISVHDVRFLLAARAAGVSFDRVLMIGRQNVFENPTTLEREFALAGALPPGRDPLGLRNSMNAWAEPLFHALGARTVDSMDVSDFEQASLLHDLNEPIPDSLRGRYDIVFDGGTLEHVFNYPTALKSCMEMVCSGGSLFLQAPANNLMGHGFYQLSPELFYAALSNVNGYEVVRMTAQEDGGATYDVADPLVLGRRVELTNARAVMLRVHARRLTVVPIFAQPPQQSDYVSTWANAALGTAQDSGSSGIRSMAVRWITRVFPKIADQLRAVLAQRRHRKARAQASFANSAVYRRSRQ